MFLELKIPPVMLVMMTAFIMAVQAQFSVITIALPWQIAISVMALGMMIITMAVWQFKQAKTTVNPMTPNQSNKIVNTGIFSVSRNPMYLGMTIILIGVAIYLGELMAFIWVIGFVLYMTKFQIKPEERILSEKFGDEFKQYCQAVRRWI
ncbi:MAG: isoprenylcysteine carboxylmethyltransferase family protein [Moraxella sp.]|nr:isoprenylcysteine carboxylmethyltransferase family protein [Moraxella sp.]